MSLPPFVILRISLASSLFSGLFLSTLYWSQTGSQTTAQVAAKSVAVATSHKPLTVAQRKAHYKNVVTKINELLSDPDAARGFWGINVVSLATGQTVYEQNADK